VEFVEYQSRQLYLATYRSIDVCLDTIPYNGHTTSLDAFWMGVPVVTRTLSPHGRSALREKPRNGLPEHMAAMV
jgi:protein O-GlcNAc transferase